MKYKLKRHSTLQPWQLKLQHLLLSGQVKERPGHLYRLDVQHQPACAIRRGQPCNCDPHVSVDGVQSCKP